MRLSEHFTLEEFTRSTVARELRIDNTPSDTVIEALRVLAERMDWVRDALGGRAIDISSGYRSAALNRAVGGSTSSDHLKGLAADFTCPAFGTPAEICRALERSTVPYKQLIYEHRWVHISFDYQAELVGRPPRRELLTRTEQGYTPGVVERVRRALA